LLEKVVSLVIDNDKGGEVLHPDFPYGFHAEFLKGHQFDRFDILLG